MLMKGSYLSSKQLGRSAEEDYPHHCSCASLVAQLVNNMLLVRENWVRSLHWEDLLVKKKATHSKESDTTE